MDEPETRLFPFPGFRTGSAAFTIPTTAPVATLLLLYYNHFSPLDEGLACNLKKRAEMQNETERNTISTYMGSGGGGGGSREPGDGGGGGSRLDLISLAGCTPLSPSPTCYLCPLLFARRSTMKRKLIKKKGLQHFTLQYLSRAANKNFNTDTYGNHSLIVCGETF